MRYRYKRSPPPPPPFLKFGLCCGGGDEDGGWAVSHKPPTWSMRFSFSPPKIALQYIAEKVSKRICFVCKHWLLGYCVKAVLVTV